MISSEVLYTLYLVFSIAATVYVARTLFRHGAVFLVDIFRGNKELSESVNRLLLTGFYLVNIGYVLVTVYEYSAPDSLGTFMVILGRKIGWIVLVLGFWHFFNMFVLFGIRRRALQPKRPHFPMPMPPQG